MAACFTEITAILREALRDQDLELASATRFDGLTGWDSMDLIAAVVEIECRFDLQFTLSEIDRLTTVGDLLRMIETKQALAAA